MSTEVSVRRPSTGPFVLSVLIITVGLGWLLSAQGIGRGIDWVWTLSLGIIGVLTFVLGGGVDKLTIFLGPFFLVSSVFSILRQTGKLDVDTETPLLVILVGILLMIAQTRWIPVPSWYEPLDSEYRKTVG